MTSKWINMNVLSLDEERVVVERQETSDQRCHPEARTHLGSPLHR